MLAIAIFVLKIKYLANGKESGGKYEKHQTNKIKIFIFFI